MNNLIKKSDVSYLPTCNVGDTMLDVVDLRTLNDAYAFAQEYKANAFCTFHFLIPYLHSRHYTTPLSAVIDFPDGNSSPEKKIFQLGQAEEILKKSSSGHVDIVLNNNSASEAVEDLFAFELINIPKLFKTRYIIELGVRPNKDVVEILKFFHPDLGEKAFKCEFIKSNTGRKNCPSFFDKLEQLKWLRRYTNLPLKIAGGINSWAEIEQYEKEIRGENIYGVSYDKVRSWK